MHGQGVESKACPRWAASRQTQINLEFHQSSVAAGRHKKGAEDSYEILENGLLRLSARAGR